AYPSGTNVSGVDNAGSTTRSAFTAGPRDGSRPAQSKSVQCTWGMHKVSQGQGQATGAPATASGGLAAGAGLSQDLRDFVSTFAARIKGDGDLSQQFAQTKQAINGAFHARSASEFFEQGLKVLADVLGLVLEGALAVTNAFVDGLLKVFGDL